MIFFGTQMNFLNKIWIINRNEWDTQWNQINEIAYSSSYISDWGVLRIINLLV